MPTSINLISLFIGALHFPLTKNIKSVLATKTSSADKYPSSLNLFPQFVVFMMALLLFALLILIFSISLMINTGDSFKHFRHSFSATISISSWMFWTKKLVKYQLTSKSHAILLTFILLSLLHASFSSCKRSYVFHLGNHLLPLSKYYTDFYFYKCI